MFSVFGVKAPSQLSDLVLQLLTGMSMLRGAQRWSCQAGVLTAELHGCGCFCAWHIAVNSYPLYSQQLLWGAGATHVQQQTGACKQPSVFNQP